MMHMWELRLLIDKLPDTSLVTVLLPGSEEAGVPDKAYAVSDIRVIDGSVVLVLEP